MAPGEHVLHVGPMTVAERSQDFRAGATSSAKFRPERLMIPSRVGVDFSVVSVEVDGVDQLKSSGPVPAVMFNESAYGIKLKGDLCEVGVLVTVVVMNNSFNAKVFNAEISGPVVE